MILILQSTTEMSSQMQKVTPFGKC